MRWLSTLIITLLIFTSCKTSTVYVPIESVRVEYKDYFLRDSIYLKDSIIMRTKGDTVFVDRYKYLYKDKLIRDSVFITDSIQVAYPVEVVKEVNRLKNWQIILMCLGAGMIAIGGYRVWNIMRKAA